MVKVRNVWENGKRIDESGSNDGIKFGNKENRCTFVPSVPPSLSTMLKSGDVLFYIFMVTIPFPKHYKSPDQLIELLKSRGLNIENTQTAISNLKHIGYYRFSAYLYPLIAAPKENQIFKAGSSFENALAIYNFDQDLRALLFEAIAKIEVSIRSAMANIVAEETGDIFWPTTQGMFANEVCYHKTISIIDTEMRHTKEEFIAHFKQKYSNPYPLAWMLFEILPLGTMNFIYSNIANNALRKKIAAHFSLTAPVFSSWLTIIALTRNSCCHHARVWNKENAIPPAEPKKMTRSWIGAGVLKNRIFYDICIIKYFLDIISPDNDFKENLVNLLRNYPCVDVRAMGFPSNWEDEPLWQ